jgi:cobalt-zinc-cadmium efflux system outer membrane protein
MRSKLLLWAGLLPSLACSTAGAQPGSDTLTAARVVALARASAPQVRLAESDVVAARGRLSGARALGQENPSIEGVAATDDRFEQRTQWELTVPVGIGLSWAGRSGVAGAELERERRLVADARRGAVGAALAAYFRVLHGARRVELARERRDLAVDLSRTSSERLRAGEVPRLDVLLAETEEIRAESQLLGEQQGLARERIALAAALGLRSGGSLVVAGDLADRSVVEPAFESQPGPGARADVLAAESELRAARSAGDLARADLLPGLAFRLNYGHEAGEPVTMPGLAVTVPIFQHGQESRQLARARETRARVELERRQNAAAAEIEGFRGIYEQASAAVERLGERGLPRVRESEAMARESYRAGKLDLPALLVVRRELLEARREHADLLLDAALAGIDLAVAMGTFQ